MTQPTASPQVDVVILSWNRADPTMQAIDSVLGQQQVHAHLWIVDQGSDVKTLHRLRALARANATVTLIELGRNVGVPAGRNIGARLGTAPTIVSFDNDAVLEHPHTLRHVVDRLGQQPWLGAISFRVENYFTGELDASSWAYAAALKPSWRQEFTATRFVGGGHALRRSAVEMVGGYDDRLFFCEEELDLSYKLLNAGWVIVYDPGACIRHMVDPEHRVRWGSSRMFMQVRNAVFVRDRYHRRLHGTAVVAAAWLVKGIVSGQARQALRGVVAAVPLCVAARLSDDPDVALSPSARAYLEEYDVVHRGSWWRRLRDEVLAPVPVG